MWWASVGILTAILLWQAWAAGPQRALGVATALSLLVPSWVIQDVFGQPLDVRLATALVGLVLYCFHPRATWPLRLQVVDFALLGLVGVHIVSDWTNDGFDYVVPLRAYAEWLAPYLAGRLACLRFSDVRYLLPVIIGVSLTMAGGAAIEALVRVHPWEWIFGERPLDGVVTNAVRLGLLRPWGPVKHPIYFGALQLLLFPWMLYAASRAARASAPAGWFGLPFVSAAGVFFSLSRAPFLGVALAAGVAAFILKQRWRTPLLVVAGLIGVFLIVEYKTVLEGLELWSGEAQRSRRNWMTIGEERVTYSGTGSRIYLLKIYGPAMRRAGLLGYGTAATADFPPRVPVVATDTKTLELLRNIDNLYVLLILRFGYLGVVAFTLVGLTSIGGLVRLSWSQSRPGSTWYAGLAGVFSAMMLIFLTVWMPFDFGFWFLWSAGAVAGRLWGESRGNDSDVGLKESPRQPRHQPDAESPPGNTEVPWPRS